MVHEVRGLVDLCVSSATNSFTEATSSVFLQIVLKGKTAAHESGNIITDIPHRDERMGWTGDAYAFATTADYLYDTSRIWRGWHKDIWSEQQRNGSMIPPVTVPVVPATDFGGPAAVWGDVVVANPHNYCQAFGDLELLAEQFDSARAWIDTGVPRSEVGLWNRTVYQFGDWLDPKSPPDNPGGATTSTSLVADSYLIRMTELLSNIGQYLGYDDLADKYRGQHDNLLREFHTAWVTDDGVLANETQTAYAMAVTFGLLPDGQESKQAGSKLRQIVSDNNYLVGTGFAGTPALGAALTKIGGADDFYRMLLQTQTPSWLYQVAMNGTTTWERWNSLEPNGSVNAGEMTSFSE
jgi:alpha-L-rhamnosidase